MKLCTLSLTLTCLLFVSCFSDEPKKTDVEIKYEQEQEAERKIEIDNKRNLENLILKYNPITENDSTFHFTYELQEKLLKEERPLMVYGAARDIVKNDSNYTLIISSYFKTNNILAHIKISMSQLAALKSAYKYRGHFVVNPSSILAHSRMSVDSEIEDAGDVDNASSSVTFDFRRTLINIKGTLIDFYLEKEND